MKRWLLSKIASSSIIKNPNEIHTNKRGAIPQMAEMCFVPDRVYMVDDTVYIEGHLEPCVEVTTGNKDNNGGNGGGSGGGSGSGPTTKCDKQLVPTADCGEPSPGPCLPPSLCDSDPPGGGGGGGSGNGELNATFLGDVIVDKTITRNDLTRCVYNKLNQSDIFTHLIAKFEGGKSNFDLKFELVEIPDNPFGNLKGGENNSFIAQIDASWVTIRNGLEVASTFLHEAMHAEMRRFLYDKQDEGSTIPGFPGSFTEDWNNYVAEKFEKDKKNIGYVEHQIMAEYFIGFIADGLQEYDNSQLSRSHYEAIAWDGLVDTKAWEDNPDKSHISQYRHDEKIDNRPQQCSR